MRLHVDVVSIDAIDLRRAERVAPASRLVCGWVVRAMRCS